MKIKKLLWADAFLLGPEINLDRFLSRDYPKVVNVEDLLFDQVTNPSISFPPFPKIARLKVMPTVSGNSLLVPMFKHNTYHRRLYLGDYFDYRWPMLPLTKHRGGYCTATARWAMECCYWPYYDFAGNYLRVTGKYVTREYRVYKNGSFSHVTKRTKYVVGEYPRTRNRIFYADRTKGMIVVDVIGRPNEERY